MSKERYPGERRGLSIFLEELHPVVVERLGPDHLLHHAIRRAVRSADLDHLRHARTLFNHLPREQRRELSGAMVARSGSSAPPKHEMIERYGRRPPASFVSFELVPGSGEKDDTKVTMAHELLPLSALRVLVSPGTLPQTAVNGLRQIAGMIERDRRLLSDRYWRHRKPGDDPDQAGNGEVG